MRRLHHLYVSGDPYEMGFAHGAACLREGVESNLRFFSDFIKHGLFFGAHSKIDRWIRTQLLAWIRQSIELRYAENAPYEYRETLRGFAEGSRIPLSEVQSASVMPDTYMFLLGLRGRFIRPLPVQLGCTSWVSSKGEWLHARNLDFPAGKSWLENPMILETRPSLGQRVFSVSSLGIESQGITAMNESGLTLSLHLNYTTEVHTQGVPITHIGTEIMRYGRSIDDAKRILQTLRPGAGWSFLIGSCREKLAMLFEMSGRRCVEQEYIDSPKANHYLDSTLVKNQYWLSPRRFLDSHARQQSLGFSESTIDHSTLENGLGTYGCDAGPSQIHTVSSVCMAPEKNEIHLAVGPAPLANNPFVKVSVGKLVPDKIETTPIESTEFLSNKVEGRRLFAKAYEAYFPTQDRFQMLIWLDQAESIDSEPWAYPFFKGILLMQMGRWAEALEAVSRSCERDGDEDSHALRDLYQARILDLSKRRDEARRTYSQGLQTHARSMRVQAFRNGMNHPFSMRKAQRLFLDLTILDVVEL